MYAAEIAIKYTTPLVTNRLRVAVIGPIILDVVTSVFAAAKKVSLAVRPHDGGVDTILEHSGPAGADRFRIVLLSAVGRNVVPSVLAATKEIGRAVRPDDGGVDVLLE